MTYTEAPYTLLGIRDLAVYISGIRNISPQYRNAKTVKLCPLCIVHKQLLQTYRCAEPFTFRIQIYCCLACVISLAKLQNLEIWSYRSSVVIAVLQMADTMVVEFSSTLNWKCYNDLSIMINFTNTTRYLQNLWT